MVFATLYTRSFPLIRPRKAFDRSYFLRHVRCFSAGRRPPREGDDRVNKKSTKDGQKKIDRRTKNASQDSWMEQQQKMFRRPRFGPKSQKYFEAALNSSKKYGIRNLNLKLVKDSSDIPILIPGGMLIESTRSQSQDQDMPQGSRRRRRKLPVVNAAALLDATAYCKKSAFPGGVVTKSGTEAAKRLLRGKKDLVDMLRGHIILQQNQRPFCLAGHGVPKQLLQDHINFADSMLQRCNEPAECSFRNLEEDNFDSFPDCIKIRGHDGKSRIFAWPMPPPTTREKIEERKVEEVDVAYTWEDRLALYLAVMDRFTSKLGLVGSCLHKDTRKQWSVKIYRGMAFPLEVISRPEGDEGNGPVPILEWSPLNRVSNKQPHISIRIQGTPDHEAGPGRAMRDPVTLVYDALFQEDPRLEPVTAG